jgi:hypothetical protein
MKSEYDAIAGAGIVLQLDCPDRMELLAGLFDSRVRGRSRRG